MEFEDFRNNWKRDTFVVLKWDELQTGDFYGPNGWPWDFWTSYVVEKKDDEMIVDSVSIHTHEVYRETVKKDHFCKDGWLRRVSRCQTA